MDWRERITVDPAVRHGQACIKGTRVMVAVVLGGGKGVREEEKRRKRCQEPLFPRFGRPHGRNCDCDGNGVGPELST